MQLPPNTLTADIAQLEDMQKWSQKAVLFLDGKDLSTFQSDELVQSAVIRAVEIIGEAARRVSDTTRKIDPTIPWPLIVGMRHILAHEYGRVDPAVIHRIVVEHLPIQIEQLGALIKRLKQTCADK